MNTQKCSYTHFIGTSWLSSYDITLTIKLYSYANNSEFFFYSPSIHLFFTIRGTQGCV